MAKNSKELTEETEKLKIENEALQQQLNEVKKSINTIRTENIDALVIAHEKALNIYIERTADKPYRILIEKMHEGAVTLNEEGIILFCNSSFANMINLPLQTLTGTKFEKYMDDSLMEPIIDLINSAGVNALKKEGKINAYGGKVIPVLMSVNALTLDELFVLNIIFTDLTIQNDHQQRLKVKAKLIKEKNKEFETTNKELAFQIGENQKHAAELAIANKEITLAAELVIANKELAFQNEEKDKRTAELVIANNELAYQIKKKKKTGSTIKRS